MGDVSTARLICVQCGLPILDDDAVVGPAGPDAIHAGERVCIARLRDALDAANRERAAANRVALRLRGELDDRDAEIGALRRWLDERLENNGCDRAELDRLRAAAATAEWEGR